MKKKCRFSWIIGLLFTMLLFPISVSAAGDIDTSHEVSLTLTYENEGTPLAGAVFSLFHVANVDTTGKLSIKEPFTQFSVDITGENEEAWKLLASTLSAYVQEAALTADATGTTDDQGICAFTTADQGLKTGLYLVLGQRHEQEMCYYDAIPFMTMLPTTDMEANDWMYEITALPKFRMEKVGTVDKTVQKIWKSDKEDQRPEQIQIHLLCDGQIYDTVTLDKKGNWRYAWTELDNRHQWQVTEVVPSGYTVTIEENGNTFVVTNIGKDTGAGDSGNQPGGGTGNQPGGTGNQPGGSGNQPGGTGNQPGSSTGNLPQTGQLWWPIPCLLCAGVLCLILGMMSRRRRDHEA